MKKITPLTLIWTGIKLNFLQASWNFERLQNVGFLFAIYNILKRVYGKDSPEFLMAVRRHMSFFNTHIFFSSAVAGVIARLEEDLSNDDPKAKGMEIENTKLGIMGPMAAIGDSLFWSGIKPFALLLGCGIVMLAGYSLESFISAAVLSIAFYNIPRLVIKSYLLFKAYFEYRELFVWIQKIKFQDIMKSIKLVGMGLLGGIVAGYLKINDHYILPSERLDNLIFLLVFILTATALRRKTSVSNIFVSVIVLSILISYITRG